MERDAFAKKLPKRAEKKTFRERQQQAGRVVQARKNAESGLRKRFHDAGVSYPARVLHLRAFKKEGEVELWAGNQKSKGLKKVHTFKVCAASGLLGEKTEQGDFQVPEGFYVVNRYNAWSSYHLSLGIDYPNRSDRLRRKNRKQTTSLGGDIFIHGDCVTIGCLPLENGPIEELYLALLDSKLKYYTKTSVHLYPGRMNNDDMPGLQRLLTQSQGVHSPDSASETWRRWQQLQRGYLAFEKTHRVPSIRIDARGDYQIKAK
ncbi:MAG: L,D-transpeptidase family protein [Deltaproteobacteria bacterium]|nr:L,D-transpeptidase family protein [Deltaproteobacteria bacterium]